MMPKIKTLRRYYEQSPLTDAKLEEAAEWVRKYLRQNHISPQNKILRAIITWEEAGNINKIESVARAQFAQLVKNKGGEY